MDYQTGHTGVLLIKKDNYGKIHHYRIIAKDKAGSQTTSKDYQFTAP